MKKKILVIVISLIVSLISIEVKADTLSTKFEVSPNRINYYWSSDGSIEGYCTSYSTNTIGVYSFYRCLSPSTHVPTSVRALYTNNQFSSVRNDSKSYSVFFVLYMANTNVRTINSVTVDAAAYHYSCNVLSNDAYSVNTNDVIYPIYCPSVVMNGGNFYVNANFDSDNLNSSSGTFYWGISQFFTFVDNANNQEVVNAINSLKTSINNNSNQAHQDSQAIQDTITEDHTYNNNASETINGQNDINNQTQAEENLMDSLDFSGANNLDISINPNSSNFIWSIIERIRLLPKITLLMTSVLGLGIIKMILNR